MSPYIPQTRLTIPRIGHQNLTEFNPSEPHQVGPVLRSVTPSCLPIHSSLARPSAQIGWVDISPCIPETRMTVPRVGHQFTSTFPSTRLAVCGTCRPVHSTSVSSSDCVGCYIPVYPRNIYDYPQNWSSKPYEGVQPSNSHQMGSLFLPPF